MSNVGSEAEGLPPGVDQIPGPRVQREVLLRPKSATLLPQAQAKSARASVSQAASDFPRGGNGRSAQTSAPSPAATQQQQPQPAGTGLAAAGQQQQQQEGEEAEQPALVYACSWWCASQVDGYLQDRSKPIWVSLAQSHLELYREVGSTGSWRHRSWKYSC